MTETRARRTGALIAALALSATLLAPAAATAGPADHAERWERTAVTDARERAREAAGRGAAQDPTTFRTSAATDHDLRDGGATSDLRFACPDGRVPASEFDDLQRPFADAIECLVWYGVTQGRTATTFDQGRTVNRVQMAVFLHRMLDSVVTLPEYDGQSDFADVPDDGFGAAEINVLASQEFADRFGEVIVAGRPGGTFDAGAAVRRDQMASFLARAIRAIAPDAQAGGCDDVFTDQDSFAAVHRENIELLCGFDIATGRQDGSFGSAATVSRGQMAAFIMRTFDVFRQGEITLLPDRNLFVDADTCRAEQAIGTVSAPLCTIQQAADLAGAVTDDLVLVRLRADGDDPRGHTGDVTLTAGEGAEVVVVEQSGGRFIDLQGTLTIDGARGALVVVAGLLVDADDGVAVTVEGDSEVALVEVIALGGSALRVEQHDGGTWFLDGGLIASDRVVDLIATAGVFLEGNTLIAAGAADAFVVLPQGAPADGLDAFTDARAGNTFDPAPPVRGELDGRAALLPAS